MKKRSSLATVPANDGNIQQSLKLATTYLDWIGRPQSQPIDIQFGRALERELLRIGPNGIGQEEDIRLL